MAIEWDCDLPVGLLLVEGKSPMSENAGSMGGPTRTPRHRRRRLGGPCRERGVCATRREGSGGGRIARSAAALRAARTLPGRPSRSGRRPCIPVGHELVPANVRWMPVRQPCAPGLWPRSPPSSPGPARPVSGRPGAGRTGRAVRQWRAASGWRWPPWPDMNAHAAAGMREGQRRPSPCGSSRGYPTGHRKGMMLRRQSVRRFNGERGISDRGPG
jgi:hypothetical protein